MIGENFVGKEMVQEILNKSADSVTESEKDILRARISYLTPEERERFGLNEKKEDSQKSEKDLENTGAEPPASKPVRQKK